METYLELKNVDDNQLKEVDMVVDDENNLVDTEIQEVDGDIDEEENLVATIGVPKDININTLDLENSDKQFRNTRHRITGCKARIKVDLHPVFGKYEITNLTKKQRKMTQIEKMFVVKASTMKLGATKAHNLYSSMKGGTQYVHGTSDDFKNHIRDADEVDKCNYKEFGDIISFDTTFRTNKYDMVFVPFTRIDNHKKCATVGSGLLLKEDTEAYTWLLRSFMTAHEKQPTMIVTDQDGAMKLAIEEKTGDVIEDIYAVKKPQQNDVNNLQRARNKGGRRGERRKSGREIALKAKTKQIMKCLCYGEKTNNHTKSTCPSNPKYVAKLARLTTAEQGTTNAVATEQAMTTATAVEQGETTTIVYEEATNAS
nr:hypothetical protein [Tanacetum cinerariifolium]